jgi:integrase
MLHIPLRVRVHFRPQMQRKADPDAATSFPHWRLHDLRRTVATHMEELGIPPHIVGSVLNHDPRASLTLIESNGDSHFR